MKIPTMTARIPVVLVVLAVFYVCGAVGCGSKPEEPNEPGYYKGSDFKQAGIINERANQDPHSIMEVSQSMDHYGRKEK